MGDYHRDGNQPTANQPAADRAGGGGARLRTVPSGLFPAGPARPVYREPHPVRLLPVLAGAAAAGVWLVLFALLGQSPTARAWWTVCAGTSAALAAVALARHGDRGAAIGVAASVAVGLAAVAGTVAWWWHATADWPLW